MSGRIEAETTRVQDLLPIFCPLDARGAEEIPLTNFELCTKYALIENILTQPKKANPVFSLWVLKTFDYRVLQNYKTYVTHKESQKKILSMEDLFVNVKKAHGSAHLNFHQTCSKLSDTHDFIPEGAVLAWIVSCPGCPLSMNDPAVSEILEIIQEKTKTEYIKIQKYV